MSEPPDPNLPDPNRGWTFALYPGVKHRFNAGEYDPETQKPQYSFRLLVPDHVRNMVEVKEYRIKTAGGDLQMWDVDNRSSWVAFVTVKRDGELIRLSEPVFRH